ncbi:MAG: tripartite tricarboxylate transporter substrate binding protein [Alphaproteobacteria bacterium]|nr:tripartite tricarboxylate transporter substrate binding protein [Alphaproteobacteria bacterium]
MRRLALAVLATAAFVSAPALAQDWPTQPIKIIVPAPAGGGTADTIARILADELDKRLKQRFLIDNKPGANGNIGATAASRTAPDGTNFLFSWAGTLATNMTLYKNLQYHSQRDFDPVVLVGNVPNILVVNKALGPKTFKEFDAFARANPGKINYASTGNGSSMHLSAELYATRNGASMTHVPYNSPGQATTELIAGQIQAMFQLVTGIAPHVKSGNVQAIAILSDKRAKALPEVPTVAEAGYAGLEFGTWFGILAPKGTPAHAIAKLNATVNEVLKDEGAAQKLEANGLEILGGPPQRLAKQIADEITRHAAIIDAAKIKID